MPPKGCGRGRGAQATVKKAESKAKAKAESKAKAKAKAKSKAQSAQDVLRPDFDAEWLWRGDMQDDHHWKYDSEATAFAAHLLATSWEPAVEGVAVLPLTQGLVNTHKGNGYKLVMRSSMRALWDVALSVPSHIERIAIIGNPGIGKSRSLIYSLRLLLGGSSPDSPEQQREATLVIFESAGDNKVFAFVPPGKDKRDSDINTEYHVYSCLLRDFQAAGCMALQKPENYYLIDPAQASKNPTFVAAKTIIACSPDPKHYKDWAKELCEELFCSLWTLCELLAARPHMNSSPPEDEVRKRFHEVGGIPRIVFGSETMLAKHQRARTKQLGDFGMIRDILQGSMLESTGNRIPTYLFAYKAYHPFNMLQQTVDFVSEGARNELFKKHYDLIMSDVLTPDAGQWLKFEDFCGWLLTEGAATLPWPKLCFQRMQWNGSGWEDMDPFLLTPQRLKRVADPELMHVEWKQLLTKAHQHTVIRTPKGYASMDYLLSAGVGVNATTGKKHDVAKALGSTLKTIGMPAQDFTLIFMVPETVFVGFKIEGSLPCSIHVQKVCVPKHAPSQ